MKDGPSKFYEFLEFLRKLEPLKELKLNSELNIPVPEKNDWAKKEYFSKLVHKKKKDLQNNNIYFHFDIGYNDFETSAMLQLVDDNVFFKGKRRHHLLGEKTLEVGITNGVEGRKNCGYVVLLHNNDKHFDNKSVVSGLSEVFN